MSRSIGFVAVIRNFGHLWPGGPPTGCPNSALARFSRNVTPHFLTREILRECTPPSIRDLAVPVDTKCKITERGGCAESGGQ
jgi:hypothetical protein